MPPHLISTPNKTCMYVFYMFSMFSMFSMAWWNLNCFLHTQRKPEGKTLTQRTQSIPKNLSHPDKYQTYMDPDKFKTYMDPDKYQTYPLEMFIRERKECYRIVLSKVSSLLKVWLKEVNSTGRLYWIPPKESWSGWKVCVCHPTHCSRKV